MNTIKYRVWDKGAKKMSPVSNISFGDDGAALTIIAEPAPRDSKIYNGLVDGENGVLMQYTGLKDKTGKDIYEGDIVHLWGRYRDESSYKIIGIVEFKDFLSQFSVEVIKELNDRNGVASTSLSNYDADIVGNIFENENLLK